MTAPEQAKQTENPFEFLKTHRPKTMDVDCSHGDPHLPGYDNCDNEETICVFDDETWPCPTILAFRAGRIAAFRMAAFALETESAAAISDVATFSLLVQGRKLTQRADRMEQHLHDVENPV